MTPDKINSYVALPSFSHICYFDLNSIQIFSFSVYTKRHYSDVSIAQKKPIMFHRTMHFAVWCLPNLKLHYPGACLQNVSHLFVVFQRTVDNEKIEICLITLRVKWADKQWAQRDFWNSKAHLCDVRFHEMNELWCYQKVNQSMNSPLWGHLSSFHSTLCFWSWIGSCWLQTIVIVFLNFQKLVSTGMEIKVWK